MITSVGIALLIHKYARTSTDGHTRAGTATRALCVCMCAQAMRVRARVNACECASACEGAYISSKTKKNDTPFVRWPASARLEITSRDMMDSSLPSTAAPPLPAVLLVSWCTWTKLLRVQLSMASEGFVGSGVGCRVRRTWGVGCRV